MRIPTILFALALIRAGRHTTAQRLLRRREPEPAGPSRGGLASRRFVVTAEGLDALRRSYQAVVTLARGLEGLLGRA